MKYIIVTFTIEREGDQCVSRCLELGTASCGDTEPEALDNIIDATELYLNTLEDLGECAEVLLEKGLRIHSGESAGERLQFDPNSNVHPGVFPLPETICA